MGLKEMFNGGSDELEELKDALVNELKDIYNAENQLVKALPKMEKRATNPKLKKAIRDHLEETKNQVQRLERIAEELEERLTGKTCKGMQGLIAEGEEAMEEESENEALIDALLIGAAQRVEHYEIAAYGTARAMAEQLGETRVVKLLDDTIKEEGAADKKLSQISESDILPATVRSSERGSQGKRNGSRSSRSMKSTARSNVAQSSRKGRGGRQPSHASE